MRRRQNKDVLANLAHLLGFTVNRRIRGKKGDRVQDNDPDGHVGPAAPLHVFMIQRNDHGDASRLESELRNSAHWPIRDATGIYDTATPQKPASHFGSSGVNATCPSLKFPLSVTPVTPPTQH